MKATTGNMYTNRIVLKQILYFVSRAFNLSVSLFVCVYFFLLQIWSILFVVIHSIHSFWTEISEETFKWASAHFHRLTENAEYSICATFRIYLESLSKYSNYGYMLDGIRNMNVKHAIAGKQKERGTCL